MCKCKKVEINLLHLKKDKNVKCVWSTVSESTESGTQKVTLIRDEVWNMLGTRICSDLSATLKTLYCILIIKMGIHYKV